MCLARAWSWWLQHSVGVKVHGALLIWGRGAQGQLGHGDVQDGLSQERIGRELLGGWQVMMVACGAQHTLVLTVGGLWTCGPREYGVPGHGDEEDKLMLTQVAVECFRGMRRL